MVPSSPRPVPSRARPRVGFDDAVFGQDRVDVGHVVLQAQYRPAVLFQGEPGTQVFRVEIGHAGHGGDLQYLQQMLQDLLVEAERCQVVQVADVLAGEGQSRPWSGRG